MFLLLRAGDRRGWRRRLHHYSEKRQFALELRFGLLMLFLLCTLATATHVSIMLSGFALGLVVAAIGPPRRLARQLFGITEGFFAPLFFVWLGASLQIRELGERPGLIVLGVVLGFGALLAHSAARALGLPLTRAVLSGAQLGMPVAAATLGTQEHLLAAGEPSALMLGALLTIASTSFAGMLGAIITIAFNVPLNNHLDTVEPAGLSVADAAGEWQAYPSTWTAWNHARTATAIAAPVLIGVQYR